MSKIYPPIYIAGPTASGKSALAVKLAKIFDSVIISADSMQIYRTLDIGTAKEDPVVRARIPHKLIDVVNPSDEFSVAEFARMAKIEIDKAQNEGKLPIVVGGTGLYFEALLYPMSFSNTNKNEELRANLQDELQRIGAHAMHEKLANLDPETANRLHENDTKRVIRALEIVLSTGKTLSQTQDEREKPDVIMVALNTDRQALYERINARVDKMFEQGLVQEVLSVGDFSYQSMQAIGYKEFADCKFTVENGKFVIEQSELDQIKDKIKQHSRNYAKRQLTWFRKYDFVKWFDVADADGAIEYMTEKIREKTVET
ncbi:MAG TPA: tRNA (adenosine(37)-N6)-dimethylallyltransferase MiaA [Clostridiales bacterium]|nr:tRNA (adenosine(37)-N6)-dimethylallyltransferase MiaA [Clostridiales bacterium]